MINFNRIGEASTRFVSCAATTAVIAFCYVGATPQANEPATIDSQNMYEPVQCTARCNTLSIPKDVEVDPVDDNEVRIKQPTYLLYVDGSSVYYRSQPVISEWSAIGLLERGQEVNVVCQEGEWCKCIIDETEVYIHATLLVSTKEETIEKPAYICDSEIPLDANIGRVNGPSGEETYYNLNMNGCVKRMRSLGYDYEYWIRDDGVKMFGDYVMVAADFKIRPLGTILETSLGTGIVVDTGDFIYDNSAQLDVAVNW